MNPSGLLIQSVSVYPYDIPLFAPFKIASANLTHVNNIVVGVSLQNGITGYGEGAVLPPVTVETQEVALDIASGQTADLIGAYSSRWRRIGMELTERIPGYPSVRAAIEMAVLDAFTRSLNLPLHCFFGGVCNQVVTDITIPICEPPEAERLAARYRKSGFEIIKTKIGLDLAEDIQRLQAIRRGHPDCRLVLDANEGYSERVALQLLEELAMAGIPVALLEQPVAREDFDAMGRLTRATEVPVAADESCCTPADAVRIVRQGAADVINIKLAKCGVVQALDIAAIARSAGLGLMIGEMVESRLSTGFAACLCAGLGGFDWVDLDTPMLMAEDPVEGGYLSSGPVCSVAQIPAGQGGVPRLTVR